MESGGMEMRYEELRVRWTIFNSFALQFYILYFVIGLHYELCTEIAFIGIGSMDYYVSWVEEVRQVSVASRIHLCCNKSVKSIPKGVPWMLYTVCLISVTC